MSSVKSLLQTKLWSQFKARHGWRYHEILLEEPIFVLQRQLPAGKSLFYAPEVSLKSYSEKQLQHLAHQIQKIDNSVIFFRLELLEPLGDTTGSLVAALKTAGYQKAFEETQPEHRQWLDISADLTTILVQMKEKGRYNIRLAERKGVTTRVSTDTSDVEVFYQIFRQTAERDGFKIRSKQYFLDLCQTLFENKAGEIVIAEHAGRPLAALIITYYDQVASYLYGASSDSDRNLMAPYAAHYAAIQSAKQHGCSIYDLLQVAPGEAAANTRYQSLTHFKERFGGRRVDLIGGWDYVYKPVWYQMFSAIERHRRSL